VTSPPYRCDVPLTVRDQGEEQRRDQPAAAPRIHSGSRGAHDGGRTSALRNFRRSELRNGRRSELKHSGTAGVCDFGGGS
jgi:hypothetical protein